MPSAPLAATLVTFALAFGARSAFGQSVVVTRSGAAADSASSTSLAVGSQAAASVTDWVQRLPAVSGADLVRVETDTPLQLRATVTVLNPTNAPIPGGTVALSYSYYAAGGAGTWGASDGTGTVGFGLQVPSLAPGQSLALPVWTLTRPFSTVHTAPNSVANGFWSDVRNSCVGNGPIPFTVAANVSYTGVFPATLQVTSLDLQADVSGAITLFADLSPATASVPYCPPSPHSGGQSAQLEAFGALQAGSSVFALQASALPADRFTALFIGATPGPMPFGSGLVCFGNPVLFRSDVRLADAAGQQLFELDLGPFGAGTTLYAQCVFRDAGGFGTTGAAQLPLP